MRVWSKLALVAAVAVLVAAAQAPGSFSGKVVSVTDGDTLRVMRDGESVRVRLWGIDAPEQGDDFSARAKQRLSDMTFGKVADVLWQDTDRYGRTVARIITDGRDVGRTLVTEGLAWHWPRYSGDDATLAAAQAQAKSASRGIWSLLNPLPPWEARALRATGREANRSRAASGEETIIYHGNTDSKIFHAPWCRYYTCKNCTRVFRSREEAIRTGYRPGKGCKA